MATKTNTPHNENKSPDKKENLRKENEDVSGKEVIKNPGKEGTGIAGSQLGTEPIKQAQKGKRTSREVRDLG